LASQWSRREESRVGYAPLRRITPFSSFVLARDIRLAGLMLGGLWLLDGLLQLQPYMFTHAFEVSVIQSSIDGLPEPLSSHLHTIVSAYLVPFSKSLNLVFAALELAVGVLMVTPKRLALIGGCVLSAAWSLLIWVIGEGMGGVTTFTVVRLNLRYPESLIMGFPGAALLYFLISIFILLSLKRGWILGEALRITGVAVFGVGGLLQLLPEFWDPRVQFAMFSSSVLMGSAPRLLTPAIMEMAYYIAMNTIIANMLEIIVSVALAVCFALRLPARVVVPLAAGWLGFVWVFGMGFMGLLNGTATDPGTPPLLFLLVVCTTSGRLSVMRGESTHGSC
jgi:hypothetical protein